MIKFFRKIRQNLLMENKTGRYLKYAIGEIILVVIGILIALQINNWNEQRKIKGNQEKYFSLIRTEAKNNLKEIKKVKDFHNTTNFWQIRIFNLIDGNKDTITEDYLSKAFKNVFTNTNILKYENSALSELKTSGDLKNVLNDSLRKYLIALEPLVLKVQGQEQNVIVRYRECGEYINKNGSLRTITNRNGVGESLGIPGSPQFKSSNIHLLSNDEFENNLIKYYGTLQNLKKNHFTRLENHLNKIVGFIDEELENK